MDIKDLIYKVKLRRHLKTMDLGLNYMEDRWYEIYEKTLIKTQKKEEKNENRD